MYEGAEETSNKNERCNLSCRKGRRVHGTFRLSFSGAYARR